MALPPSAVTVGVAGRFLQPVAASTTTSASSIFKRITGVL